VADGDVVLGNSGISTQCTPGTDVNCENQATAIFNVAPSGGDAFFAGASGGFSGIFGSSVSGNGVEGSSNSGYALYGDSTHATGGHIQTESQFGAGLEVQINNTGNARGAIEAQTNGAGQGLLAMATFGAGVEGHSSHGPGLLGVADAPTATALKATGKTVLSGPTTLAGKSTFTGSTGFARSGRLTIPAGKAQATKPSIILGSSSSVLATIQGNQPGVYVQGVTTVTGSRGSFTIHLNAKTPVNLPVAWFILN
jgi:hypothetical protein